MHRCGCEPTPHQLFKAHPEPATLGGEEVYTVRYVRDPQQCLDWFEAEAVWGLWTCDPGAKPNQRMTAARQAAATAPNQAQGGLAVVSFCLAGAARGLVPGGCAEPPLLAAQFSTCSTM